MSEGGIKKGEVITLDVVRRVLAYIEGKSLDDEMAHVEQDDLVFSVLDAIAAGCEDPVALAHEAVKVRDIKFSRWYA